MEESKVPVEQRFLRVEGNADFDICKKVFSDFDSKMGPNRVCVFVSFAYSDLPIGKQFEIAFKPTDPTRYVETLLILKAVTQQLAFESDGIPHGWKTICIFDFPNGIPEMISELPVVDGWQVSNVKDHVLICNKESYAAIQKHQN